MPVPANFDTEASRGLSLSPFRLRLTLGLVWLAMAAPSTLMGQNQKPVALPDLSRELRHWGVDEGLPIGRVDRVAKTPDGYLWVSGKRLLARFNGHRFETFDPGEMFGEFHDYITRLAVSVDGELWVGSNRGRYAIYRDAKFKVLELEEWPGAVSAIAPHPEGGMVACYDIEERPNAVFRIREDRIERLCPEGVDSTERAISITVSDDLRIWMVDMLGRLYEVTGVRGERADVDDAGIGHFFSLGDGSLATVGRKGIHVYGDGVWKLQTRFKSALGNTIRITDSCQDPDGNIWFAARAQDLWLFGTEGVLRPVKSGRGQIPMPVTGMVSSDSGVWFSSYTGLSQVRYSPFVNLPPSEVAPSANTITLAEDGEGTLWASSVGAICARRPGGITLERIARASPRYLLRTTGDPQGGSWSVGFRGKVTRLKDGAIKQFECDLEGERTGIAVSPAGVVWISTTAGMLRYDPEQEDDFVRVEVVADGISYGSFQHVVADPSGTVFAAAKRLGIVRLDPDGGGWKNMGGAESPGAGRPPWLQRRFRRQSVDGGQPGLGDRLPPLGGDSVPPQRQLRVAQGRACRDRL